MAGACLGGTKSIRGTGDRVRVNVQLVDAASGAHLWAHRYNTDLANLVEALDAITARLAQTLNLELIEDVGRRIERERPADLDAEDLIMRGRALFNRPYSTATLENALQAYEQALEKDSNSIEAKVGIASILLTKMANAWRSEDRQDIELAEHYPLPPRRSARGFRRLRRTNF